MTQPLVSICIPNYNYGRYLDACIQSALAQTYPNKEIILVDDHSTDDSMEIAQRYARDIHIFQNPTNLGQPQNTDRCVANSHGKYLVILHSDDLLLPHFIERLLPILERFPNVGMAVGERMETDETGIPRPIAPFYNTDCIIPGEKQAKVFLMTSYLPCQVLLRREVFDKTGGVDERFVVNLDGLLWFKCSLVSDLGYIQMPVSIYRTHADNTTSQYNRTLDHMLEYYRTLSEMFRLAADRDYVSSFFDAAVKRVGQLTLRYCHAVLRERNWDLARRFLSLALVFDPGLESDHTYRTMTYCLQNKDHDPLILYEKLIDTMTPVTRSFSYDPPIGFQPYV